MNLQKEHAPSNVLPTSRRQIQASSAGKMPAARLRFMGSLHGLLTTHGDHEPSAKRVGARASWTAATESSEPPLWVGVAVSAACFAILSADAAKAVTSRTPSPHSKTWRQIRRLMASPDAIFGGSWDREPISLGRARLRRALISIAPKRFQGSTESRPTLWLMERIPDEEQDCSLDIHAMFRGTLKPLPARGSHRRTSAGARSSCPSSRGRGGTSGGPVCPYSRGRARL
jgi:hypothetical protein